MLNDAFGHLVLINVEISQNVLTLHVQILCFSLNWSSEFQHVDVVGPRQYVAASAPEIFGLFVITQGSRPLLIPKNLGGGGVVRP